MSEPSDTMSEFVRHERTSLPYWTCLIHALGIVAITTTGYLLFRSHVYACASLGGAWALAPHLFGVFHAWSFTTCPLASRTLFCVAILIAGLSLLTVGVALRDCQPFVGEPISAVCMVAFVPILQHALEAYR